MKNLAFLLLLFTGIVKAQIVNIPDANFKVALLDYSPAIDTNNDNEIQLTEAQAVTTLSISSLHITDLTGIQSFSNLTDLQCSDNDITALDLTSMVNLTNIFAGGNLITSINLTGLTQSFGTVDISSNQMTSLTLDGGVFGVFNCSDNALTTLNLANVLCGNFSCDNNQLTALNITNSTIHELYCINNLLPSLDLSGVVIDNTLSCADNLITSLDMSNQNMSSFYCSNNLLTTLDVSMMTNLFFFACLNNPLVFLNMKNGPENNPSSQFLPNSPALEYICTDENQVVEFQNSSFLNPATVIGSYCSFEPGGDHNTISGTIRFDGNNNGCDVSDSPFSYLKVSLAGGSDSGATYTNTTGNYIFYPHTGNYTITPVIEMPAYFNISPASAVVNFPTADNSTQTKDFCISSNGSHPDLEIVLVPIGNAQPGFDALYKLIYKNKGNETVSGSINLSFDDGHTDFVSAVPATDNQSLNTLLWNYNSLLPFETRTINLTLNINSPTETPAVNLGDVLDFTVTINFSLGDQTANDNVFELHQSVTNSLDPNAKTCLEGNTVSAENIGKYLHYNINFENLGTEAATNIVVKDTIDTAKFDINSLQLLFASHPVETKIRGNVVEFIFEGINLPPSIMNPIGGHGNVLFKIKTKDNLVVGDEVANTANIFFDYNVPIQTNEARTAFTLLNNPEFNTDATVTVSPNPANDFIAIRAKSKIKSIQVFDVQGRIIQSANENKVAATLDISSIQSGIYFLKITTADGAKVERIIKN